MALDCVSWIVALLFFVIGMCGSLGLVGSFNVYMAVVQRLIHCKLLQESVSNVWLSVPKLVDPGPNFEPMSF